VHGRHRNLVVAATGTGKTVVAALDYDRLRKTLPRDRLLFVAHRREILEQPRRTYREVLGDGTFGEELVGGNHPELWRHVFASVQSLAAHGVEKNPERPLRRGGRRRVPPRRGGDLPSPARPLAPRELLGLTATPERGDGTDVRSSSADAAPTSCGCGTR
jgi:superfamily II DNA or RNA helicase